MLRVLFTSLLIDMVTKKIAPTIPPPETAHRVWSRVGSEEDPKLNMLITGSTYQTGPALLDHSMREAREVLLPV